MIMGKFRTPAPGTTLPKAALLAAVLKTPDVNRNRRRCVHLHDVGSGQMSRDGIGFELNRELITFDSRPTQQNVSLH